MPVVARGLRGGDDGRETGQTLEGRRLRNGEGLVQRRPPHIAGALEHQAVVGGDDRATVVAPKARTGQHRHPRGVHQVGAMALENGSPFCGQAGRDNAGHRLGRIQRPPLAATDGRRFRQSDDGTAHESDRASGAGGETGWAGDAQQADEAAQRFERSEDRFALEAPDLEFSGGISHVRGRGDERGGGASAGVGRFVRASARGEDPAPRRS